MMSLVGSLRPSHGWTKGGRGSWGKGRKRTRAKTGSAPARAGRGGAGAGGRQRCGERARPLRFLCCVVGRLHRQTPPRPGLAALARRHDGPGALARASRVGAACTAARALGDGTTTTQRGAARRLKGGGRPHAQSMAKHLSRPLAFTLRAVGAPLPGCRLPPPPPPPRTSAHSAPPPLAKRRACARALKPTRPQSPVAACRHGRRRSRGQPRRRCSCWAWRRQRRQRRREARQSTAAAAARRP